jgi:hypothetical protein
MGFEDAPNSNEENGEVLPEQLPSFESIINKEEIDKRGEELAEKMATRVKEEIKKWVEQAAEIVPAALKGDEQVKVKEITASAVENAETFLKDLGPISQEASEYFKQKVEDEVMKKWDELFAVMRSQKYETAQEFQAQASRIEKWKEDVVIEQDKYREKWFAAFSTNLNQSIKNFTAEIVAK